MINSFVQQRPAWGAVAVDVVVVARRGGGASHQRPNHDNRCAASEASRTPAAPQLATCTMLAVDHRDAIETTTPVVVVVVDVGHRNCRTSGKATAPPAACCHSVTPVLGLCNDEDRASLDKSWPSSEVGLSVVAQRPPTLAEADRLVEMADEVRVTRGDAHDVSARKV